MTARPILAAALAVALLATGRPVLADDTAAHCAAAAILTRDAKFAEAAEEYRQALEEDPDRAEAHYGSGLLCLRNLGLYEQAAAHFRRHLALKPDMVVVEDWLREAEDKVFQSALVRLARTISAPDRVLNPATLPEAAAVKNAAEKTAPPPQAEGTLTVIGFKALAGKVTAAGGSEVRISIGGAAGVEAGMDFGIYRDGKWIGMVKVTAVRDDSSLCLPVAGKKEEPGWGFKAGDAARQREDILGAGLAEETRARREVMGWQREEQDLDRELESLKEREKKLIRALIETSSPSAVAKAAEDIKELTRTYGDWRKRAADWTEGILRQQEEMTAGNPHIAAFRRSLAQRRRFEEEEFGWKEIELDMQMEIVTFVAAEGGSLRKSQAVLESAGKAIDGRAKDLQNRIKSRRYPSQTEIENYNTDLGAFQKRLDEFNATVQRFQDRLDVLLGGLAGTEADVEGWRASDRVFNLVRADARRSLADSLLNLGRYDLLLGRYPKAVRVYRSLLEMKVEGTAGRSAREGLELALVKQLLAGGVQAPEATGLIPPLRTLWKAALGPLQGTMRAEGGFVYAFFTQNEGSALRALRVSDGAAAWEVSFPGSLAGRWSLAGGEIVFASSLGVLYRVNALDGKVLGRWSLGEERQGYRRLDAFPSPAGAWWLAALDSALPGGQPAERLVYTDFGIQAAHAVATVDGSIGAVHGHEGAILVEVRKKAGRAGDTAAQGQGASPKVAVGPESWTQCLEPAAGAGTMKLPPGYLVNGLKPGPDWLAVGVTEKSDTVGETRNHVILLPREKTGEEWRVTFRGRQGLADILWEGSLAYILLNDGTLAALDLKERKLLWTIRGSEADESAAHFAEFLSAGGDELVMISGTLAPPWHIRVISRQEGVMITQALISRGSDARPVYAAGFLYLVERDGSLRAVNVAREEEAWALLADEGKSILLPAVGDRDVRVDGITVASEADRMRAAWTRYRSVDEPVPGQPLLTAGGNLLYHNRRDGTLQALAPAATGDSE